jgi:hypothetical protein
MLRDMLEAMACELSRIMRGLIWLCSPTIGTGLPGKGWLSITILSGHEDWLLQGELSTDNVVTAYSVQDGSTVPCSLAPSPPP